ncbi:Tetraspanin-8 [Branchiostoma belcheri]|nr:Tetraspanin-8 [Branchiostoma belcheri]
MAEGVGMNCVKYLLFFFNFLFWVAGLFLVGVGIWIRVDDNALKILHNLDNLDETVVYAGCYAFIGVGAVALVVGFFGCCGAVMENKCLLGTFFACLFVLLIAEVGVAIYAVVKKPDAEKFLKEGLDKIAEKKYQDLDPELQRLVDFFQKEEDFDHETGVTQYVGRETTVRQRDSSTTCGFRLLQTTSRDTRGQNYSQGNATINMPPKRNNNTNIDEEVPVSVAFMKEMLEQQKVYYKDLLDQQEKNFRSFVQIITDSANQRMDNLVREMQDLKNSLNFSQGEISDTKETSDKNADKLKQLEQNIMTYNTEVTEMANKLDYIENQSRRNNLIFDGIKDDRKETWEQSETKVKEVLRNKLRLNTDSIEIERAHRNGKPGDRPRPIVVKLLRYKDKQNILRQAKMLKGTQIFINEDFSDKIRQKRKDLQPALRAARERGQVAYIRFDKLVISDRRTADN